MPDKKNIAESKQKISNKSTAEMTDAEIIAAIRHGIDGKGGIGFSKSRPIDFSALTALGIEVDEKKMRDEANSEEAIKEIETILRTVSPNGYLIVRD